MNTREQSATLKRALPSLIAVISCTLAAFTAACIKIEVNTNSNAAGPAIPTVPPPPPSGGGGSGPIVTPPPHGDSVVFHPSDILVNSNVDDCFLTGDGWKGYLQLPMLFEGPHSGHPLGVYRNDDDLTNLVVKTCNVLNPTNWETGIVLIELPDKKDCVTNNCLLPVQFSYLARLEKQMMPTQYIARVYLKYTNITSFIVDWNYQ